MLDSAVGVRSNSAEWAAVLHGKPSPRRLQTITSSGRDHLPCGRRYDFMLHMACTSAGRRDPRRPVAGGTSRAWVCSASLRLDALDVLSVADALDVPRGSPRRHKLHHDDGRAQPQVAQRQHLRTWGVCVCVSHVHVPCACPSHVASQRRLGTGVSAAPERRDTRVHRTVSPSRAIALSAPRAREASAPPPDVGMPASWACLLQTAQFSCTSTLYGEVLKNTQLPSVSVPAKPGGLGGCQAPAGL